MYSFSLGVSLTNKSTELTGFKLYTLAGCYTFFVSHLIYNKKRTTTKFLVENKVSLLVFPLWGKGEKFHVSHTLEEA